MGKVFTKIVDEMFSVWISAQSLKSAQELGFVPL